MPTGLQYLPTGIDGLIVDNQYPFAGCLRRKHHRYCVNEVFVSIITHGAMLTLGVGNDYGFVALDE